MTLVDLQKRRDMDGVVVVQRQVSVPGPTLLVRMDTPPYPTIAEVQSHPDQTFETRRFRYGHLLGPGVTPEELSAWRACWPNHPIPYDLAQLLLKTNGIHLWADLDQERAYIGIAPLAEWEDAAEGWWAEFFKPSAKGGLILSYHLDGNGAVVLDTKSGVYRWYEWEDLDNPQMIGNSVESLLDWLWAHARFDPRD